MNNKLFSALFLLCLLLGVGTWVYHNYEGWTFKESFFTSVMVLSTNGFSGELYPKNENTRLFTAFFALTGISISLYALSILNDPLIKQLEKIPKKLHPHFFNNEHKKV